MATEPDQTRWVGIRPTPDCNDIPTTTKKVAPAIGDLQAIKGYYHDVITADNQNCTVRKILTALEVNAGELWIVNNIVVMNMDSLCDLIIHWHCNGSYYTLAAFYSVEPEIRKSWRGHLVLHEGCSIKSYFELGGASDDIKMFLSGYKIGLY